MSDKIVLSIQDVVQETSDTVTIHFARPEQQLSYLSGQFITLIAEIGGREERRSYSLCSSPYVDGNLSITIKRVKGGKMSNHLNNNSKVGDTMVALPPAGNFKFEPKQCKRHIVLIGGGSGITPLFSIIKSALVREPASAVSLIYVNSNRENTIYYQQLEQWRSEFSSRFRIVYYWSDAVRDDQPKAGFWTRLFKRKDADAHRINPVRLEEILNGLPIENEINTEFYVCGPQELMEMTASTLQKLEFPTEVIHKESFYTAAKTNDMPTVGDQEHQIRILSKGKDYQLNVPSGKTILLAGLESGIDLPYSCQSGSCISCMGKCLSGKIEMSSTEGLSQEQIKDGYVLTCVGYPKSDGVLIEFE